MQDKESINANFNFKLSYSVLLSGSYLVLILPPNQFILLLQGSLTLERMAVLSLLSLESLGYTL